MVSDDDVWKAVRKQRRDRLKQLRIENGIIHRCIKWIVGKPPDNYDEDEDDQSIPQESRQVLFGDQTPANPSSIASTASEIEDGLSGAEFESRSNVPETQGSEDLSTRSR